MLTPVPVFEWIMSEGSCQSGSLCRSTQRMVTMAVTTIEERSNSIPATMMMVDEDSPKKSNNHNNNNKLFGVGVLE